MKIPFLKSGLFKIVLLFLPILITGILFTFQKKNELDITASENKFNLYPYSDNEQKGNSKVKIIQDNKIININYKLHEGYAYPYAGLTIKSKEPSGYINLSDFNCLKIKISASKGKRIPIYLGLYIPGYTDTSRILTYKYMEKFLDLNKQNNTYKISFSEFKAPTWWHQVNKVSENGLASPDFSKTLFINIQNCILINKDEGDNIKIEQIIFYKDHSEFFILSSILISIYYLLFGMLWLLNKRNVKKELVIKYEQVETLDLSVIEQDKIISFISSQYSNSNLSLSLIQKETGVSESKISSIIKKTYGLTFKQYLNNLRLEEAKRLLKETNLQVSEIAYKIGYGNISHFNRVFKEVVGTSPNDFRKNLV